MKKDALESTLGPVAVQTQLRYSQSLSRQRQPCGSSCHVQGVPEERVAGEVAAVLARTALPLEMAGRPAGQYSGGSKRKLALGIALVGGSPTILLDEPSSGMVGILSASECDLLVHKPTGKPGLPAFLLLPASYVFATHLQMLQMLQIAV